MLTYIYTHTHTFNGPFSWTTQVSRYQKGKPIWILLKQETVSKKCIAVRKVATPLRELTCHMGSPSVTCHPADHRGDIPALTPTEAGTRVSGSAISGAICKSAPRSKQITTPASHHSVFYRPDALPAAQRTASKH